MGARVAWGRSIFTFSSPACTHKSHNTRVTLSLKTIMSTLLLAHTDVTTHESDTVSQNHHSTSACIHRRHISDTISLKKTSLLLFCLHTQMWHEWCSLSKNKKTSSFLPVYTDITWVTLSLKKHYFPSPACTRSCHKSDTVCKKHTTALLPACTVTQVTLSLKKNITSPLLPAHIEVTWVTLYKTSLLLSCLCTQMSLEKVERQGLIKNKKILSCPSTLMLSLIHISEPTRRA